MTTTINNEHKKLNVPNLRFPEFLGEWSVTTLQKDCIVNPTNEKIADKFVYVDLESVKQGQLYKYQILTKDNAPSRAQRVLHTDDILFQCVRPYQMNNYMVKGTMSDIQWVASTGYAQIRTQTDYPAFLYCVLNTSKYNKAVMVRCTGSSYPAINSEDLSKIPFYKCGIAEQKKIADFLSLLDERIATQNKIIEDLKKLKSAISHILFSSKGAIHLSEIANVVMGQSPSSNAYNDQGLGMPLVQGNLDISNGKTTPRLYTAEFNQTTEKGNIILTVRAPVGEVAKATQKVCLGRGVCAIIPHEENMSDFIYQYLTFYKFMWRRYEQGSTFTSINGSDVRNIFCPKVRNVSILTLLDIKINIEERVVKQYQSQKQYMLYQMFI